MSTIVGFPKVDYPMVDENRILARPWYEFLRQMWIRTGGAVAGLLTLSVVGNNDYVTTALSGGAAQPITVVGSPQIFTASFQGCLVGFGCEMEFSRNSGTTWYKVTLSGTALPMMTGDMARLTWYSTQAPTLTFFPSGI